MDSLLFYFQNSNPVWAHNGTLLSESGEKGQPQVWPQSLNSGFHVAGGDNMHFCAHVFLGVQEMWVWDHDCVPQMSLVTGGVLI